MRDEPPDETTRARLRALIEDMAAAHLRCEIEIAEMRKAYAEFLAALGDDVDALAIVERPMQRILGSLERCGLLPAAGEGET